MIRNLKALGLSLVALFAMGALGASTASATDVFTVGKSPALLTGTSHNHKFTFGTPYYECTTSQYASTIANGASIATFDVTYEGTKGGQPPQTAHCSGSNGSMTFHAEGCHYDMTGNTTATHGGGTDATVWITCPAGKKTVITTSAGPTISFPAQTPTQGGVTYTNVSHEGAHSILASMTITGITYTCAPTFTCTLAGIPHHSNNSSTTVSVTLTAYEDKNQAGVITPASEGSRVDLTSSSI